MLWLSRLILPLCAIGAFIGGIITPSPSTPQETLSPIDAKAVANLWAPPKAPKSEIETLQPNNPKLLVQHIRHQLSFGKLWNYYANRCGFERSYVPNRAHIEGGSGRYGDYYVDDEVSSNGNRVRTLFLVKNPDYSLTVTLEPRNAGSTNITMTVISK